MIELPENVNKFDIGSEVVFKGLRCRIVGFGHFYKDKEYYYDLEPVKEPKIGERWMKVFKSELEKDNENC